ncbi:urease accessory protein UreD [Corallococcus sp. H22C18031201]|uniref:urease accessory protein UreD n=1 Tax=Citreicoccus inhibens TaxID=2849499 RepID=UPI000E7666C3|nr:urease accessory protein UreD [Citreicoccus inhibens]MBU8894662.1 urease accessory protein UreD [Citreicoccus inhibens]RJS25245.1 urease accessory protein UreD [Corallococcus sp. H22C18031201]
MARRIEDVESGPPRAAGRAGTARLVFERGGARTIVRTALAHSPLRLLTPRNHGHAAWVYSSTLGGGLVDGDSLRLDLEVGPGATALLASQGANRVYRSPSGCGSQVRARVAEDALLALVPDPTACFAGARYAQLTEVRMARSASLVLTEVLTSGRSAQGERWAFARQSSTVRVVVEDRALLDECWLLDPAHGPVAERMGRFEALATVVLVGPATEAARARLARDFAETRVTPRAGLVRSASPLGDAGLLLRAAAVSVEALQGAVRAWLDFLPEGLGDDPWARRV